MSERGCPCLYVAACRPQCTCASPVLSGGCDRCCRYGNLEQRQASADHIVRREDRVRALEEALDGVLADSPTWGEGDNAVVGMLFVDRHDYDRAVALLPNTQFRRNSPHG